jgi:hypothetical protein
MLFIVQTLLIRPDSEQTQTCRPDRGPGRLLSPAFNPMMIYIYCHPQRSLFLFFLTSFDASIVRGTPPSMGFVLRRCDRLRTMATAFHAGFLYIYNRLLSPPEIADTDPDKCLCAPDPPWLLARSPSPSSFSGIEGLPASSP